MSQDKSAPPRRSGRPGWGIVGFLVVVSVAACSTPPTESSPPPAPAPVANYELAPGQGAVGHITQIAARHGDVFPDIARQYDLGYTELVTANPGVNPWVLRDGSTVTLPTRFVLPAAPRRGIVINIAQWRLYYFPPGGGVEIHPIGVGVVGRKTPIGTTRIVRKEAHPTWYPPADIRAEEKLPASVPPGPDNPLGDYAFRLGWANYLVHGTNKPDGVGRNVSHGCVHLYPEDIERLFAEVPVGTPVRTVDQPATAGWDGDRLYLQVFPSRRQTEEIDIEQKVSYEPAPGVRQVVRAAAGRDAGLVDWQRVDAAARERTGTAVVIADRSAQASR